MKSRGREEGPDDQREGPLRKSFLVVVEEGSLGGEREEGIWGGMGYEAAGCEGEEGGNDCWSSGKLKGGRKSLE